MKLLSYLVTRAVIGLIFALAAFGFAALLHPQLVDNYPLLAVVWVCSFIMLLTIPDPPQAEPKM